MGNGLLIILLLSSLKSEMKQPIPFILGVINVGAAGSELFVRLKTTKFTYLLTSVFRIS